MINESYGSPFQPYDSVAPEKFKGRHELINDVFKYIPSVINQKRPHHFFVTGKKGMGKTSFVKYLATEAENIYDMFPIYINNSGCDTIDELIELLIETLLKELNKKNWGRSIIDFITTNISEINIKGTNIKFNQDLVEYTKNSFADFLVKICEQMDSYNKGIFIVIDDINGLSNNPKFPNWYKSFAETIEFYESEVPVAFTLVSYIETFNKLMEINSSFTRKFNLIKIDKLDENDIKEFFEENFENYSITFKNDGSLNQMIYYSYGMPLIMQQIGNSVFWNVENDYVDLKTANMGIKKAAIELGEKQLQFKLNKIRSEHYENILMKIVENNDMKFKKSEVIQYLDKNEKIVFDNFLKQMKNLKIINSTGWENSEEYEFSNRIYFVYFLINVELKKFLINQLNNDEISKDEFYKYY